MERITNRQSFGSGNIGCGNFTNSHNITVKGAEDEGNQIRQWFSPLKPQYRNKSVQANRVNGLGGWFLKMDNFRDWSGSQGVPAQGVLFCYGDLGVRKTHIRLVGKLSNKWISLIACNISSLVIDWLCNQVHDRDVTLAGLYCDHSAREEQSTTSMLGAIPNQHLVRWNP